MRAFVTWRAEDEGEDAGRLSAVGKKLPESPSNYELIKGERLQSLTVRKFMR